MSGPDEEKALRADIAQARGELADTVDALVAKTEVKRRVGEKVDEITERVGDKADELKERVHEVKDRVADKAGHVREQVGAKTDQLGDRAERAKDRAGATAYQAKDRTEQLVHAGRAGDIIRHRPVPAALIVAALVALIAFVVRQRGR
ncbi:MAG: DUF3618 domain-containing protein [Actinomycetota bacterium]|nr:DUF3618 domain-containing protein [Actinomycetota bacterium]